jgi:hypothetical protein
MPSARRTHRRERADYLGVEFITRWLRFVDDSEFWLDPANNAIQVRSSSRLGSRDFGVNRARIEAIRARWYRRHVSRTDARPTINLGATAFACGLVFERLCPSPPDCCRRVTIVTPVLADLRRMPKRTAGARRTIRLRVTREGLPQDYGGFRTPLVRCDPALLVLQLRGHKSQVGDGADARCHHCRSCARCTVEQASAPADKGDEAWSATPNSQRATSSADQRHWTSHVAPA